MRINFVLPAIGKSGGIDVVYRYAGLMKDMGHDVIIYKSIVAPNMHRYKINLVNIIHRIYCTFKTIILKKTDDNLIKFVPLISDRYIRESDVIIATSWPTSYQIHKLSDKCGEKWYFIQDFEVWDNYLYGVNSYRLPLKKIVISTWINNRKKFRFFFHQ